MSALSAATLQRAGLTDIVVVNRTHDRAVRLAQTVGGRAAEFGDLEREMAGVDLVISCTGAADVVITADMVTPTRCSYWTWPCRTTSTSPYGGCPV